MENTFDVKSIKGMKWDHLHTRGEYNTMQHVRLVLRGSPPHTWRILNRVHDGFAWDGITSTHVENTSTNAYALTLNKDHLHTRGEYTLRS